MGEPRSASSAVELGFVVHVLIDIAGGRTDEATREFATWNEAVEAVRAVPNLTTWRAVTIYRAEDFARMMQGAVTHP
jgi:hypothetical protein